METDSLHKVLLTSLKDRYYVIIKWKSGLEIKGKVDTCYETDNGLEIEEEDYQEFYACAVEVIEILNMPGKIDYYIKKGNLIEVSIQNKPKQVLLEDYTVIWSQ